jgi:hypothetical protein
MTLKKKRDTQVLAGSERDHKHNCSGDVTFHNGQSRAPVLEAKKGPFIFQKRTTRWSPFEKITPINFQKGPTRGGRLGWTLPLARYEVPTKTVCLHVTLYRLTLARI